MNDTPPDTLAASLLNLAREGNNQTMLELWSRVEKSALKKLVLVYAVKTENSHVVESFLEKFASQILEDQDVTAGIPCGLDCPS